MRLLRSSFWFAMAIVYLSSTYNDLKAYREEVYRALRKSRQDVIAMEDYVASDLRSVDLCLRDVEKAEIYVGLFAFRYGYVPPLEDNNPYGRSITELEYRHAKAKNKPCLIFLLEDERQKDWSAEFIDARIGEDKGERINMLRADLCTQHTVSFFSTPDKLATEVLAAVLSDETRKGLIATRVSDHDLSPMVSWDIVIQGPPYPGLPSFDRKYAPVFFGRELEVRALLDRLHEPEGRFLIVSGDSGVGKSSLVEAGVIPKLESGRLPGGQTGMCIRMLASQGERPLTALMKLLQPFAQQCGLTSLEIERSTKEVEENTPSLSTYLRALTERGSGGMAIVLFLDQLEEWFPKDEPTQPAASQDFLSAVYQATQERVLWVLATIRSDHLHRCHSHPAMLNVLRGRGHYPVGPVERFMLWDMIRKPARCAGLTITNKLVSILSEEMINNPGSLPLLAFVLQKLCEQRTEQGELSLAVYQNPKFGGLTGSISKHAVDVEVKIQQQLGARATALWPTLFRSLVIVDVEGKPVRRRLFQADLKPDMAKLVEVLLDGRLLYSEKEGSTVSLSHEKLLEAWPRLVEWLKDNKSFLVWQQGLNTARKEWIATQRSTDLLLRGLPLRQAEDLAKKNAELLTPDEQEFVIASQSLRTKQRVQRVVGAIGIGLMLWVLGTMVWLLQMGYNLDQAALKVESVFVSIHVLPQMVPIKGGTFWMGDVERFNESWPKPVGPIKIKPFAMGKYEVTFEEYDRFRIATGRRLLDDHEWGRGQRPVIGVSWDDATAYATWLSLETGTPYRLPTESEWEYAARSGAEQEAWAGTSDESQLPVYAIFEEHSENKPAVVGSKHPNQMGLYDMSGNVWEWVEDCWHKDYNGAPMDGSAWLDTNAGDCGWRVARGGSWTNFSDRLRTSKHGKFIHDIKVYNLGFRLVQDID